MMIDTYLILGIMEKEELPNLGKHSFFSNKTRVKIQQILSI